MHHKEPLRKRFAKSIKESRIAVAIMVSLTTGLGAGVTSYQGLRVFEAEKWDYLATDNRDTKLISMDGRLNVLNNKEQKLTELMTDSKSIFIASPEKFALLSQTIDTKKAELVGLSTSYATELLTSRDLHEKDYLNMGEVFLDVPASEYSKIDLKADYFEAANRMECQLTTSQKASYHTDAEHVNSCMFRNSISSRGDVSTVSSVVFGMMMFYLVLFNDTKWLSSLDKWEKLPNNPEKRKDTKKKSWLPRRRKMKEN